MLLIQKIYLIFSIPFFLFLSALSFYFLVCRWHVLELLTCELPDSLWVFSMCVYIALVTHTQDGCKYIGRYLYLCKIIFFFALFKTPWVI